MGNFETGIRIPAAEKVPGKNKIPSYAIFEAKLKIKARFGKSSTKNVKASNEQKIRF